MAATSTATADAGPRSPEIRFATEKDVPDILALIRELAEYEKALSSVEATEESLLETLSFPSSDPAHRSSGFTPGYARTLLVIDSAGSPHPAKVAGLALFFPSYSTWTSRPGIYLEDLFVRPEHRGKGYGSALLSRLAKETLNLGGKRLEWSVLKWNEPSIKFYQGDSVGAQRMEEWVGMRVSGEGLERLAGRFD